jgi:hypothetical protein
VPGTTLYFSVTADERLFVADFFTHDGVFIEVLAIAKDSTNLDEFIGYCIFNGRCIEAQRQRW